MELEDEYEELNNIISTLNVLILETNNKYYKNNFISLKEEAEQEIENISNKIKKIEKKERNFLEEEYIKSSL